MTLLTLQDVLAHQASVPWPEIYQVEQDLRCAARTLRSTAPRGRITMSFQDIQPSEVNQMAKVILVVNPLDHDCSAGGRCMNEALVAQIYSNVPGSLARPDEHEITRQRLLNIDRVRGAQLFPRGPWHQDTRFTVDIEHETATVKTSGIIPAVVIGNTNHCSSRECNTFENEGVTRRTDFLAHLGVGTSWSIGNDIR
jgi:hypothetical protein